MMIAPDIRDSSEEDRRKYINDRYPCPCSFHDRKFRLNKIAARWPA